MWKRQVVLVVLVLLTVAVSAKSQNTPTKSSNTQVPQAGAQVRDKQVSTEFSEGEERKAWILLLRKLAAEDTKTAFDWKSLAATITGGLITAAVTILTLWFNAKREAKREQDRMSHEAKLKEHEATAKAQQQHELTRMEAATTYANKLLDLRLKQLELFVAPLHALLEQSRGLYEKLVTQLLEDKENYQEVTDPEVGKKLQVRWHNEWHDWRMLDQMPPLKGNPLYGPLIAEIIRIGKEMTVLIAKYSAFSLDDSAVSDVYGEYLAHFAVLQSIYKNPRTEPFAPGQHKIGYYPRRLNGIVKARYLKLQQELQPYLEASNTILEELKRRGS